jgi:hypothetical protein
VGKTSGVSRRRCRRLGLGASSAASFGAAEGFKPHQVLVSKTLISQAALITKAIERTKDSLSGSKTRLE